MGHGKLICSQLVRNTVNNLDLQLVREAELGLVRLNTFLWNLTLGSVITGLNFGHAADIQELLLL